MSSVGPSDAANLVLVRAARGVGAAAQGHGGASFDDLGDERVDERVLVEALVDPAEAGGVQGMLLTSS